MNNRKAKILMACRNERGVWQWLKICNRRKGLIKSSADIASSFCKKPSAAQNRRNNHGK